MVEDTQPATLLHALVSTLHRTQANPIFSKVGAPEAIDGFSEPEEVHWEGTPATQFVSR